MARADFSTAIQQDFLAWSRAGCWKPTWIKFIQLILLQPGFQLAVSVRLQECAATFGFAGKLFRRVLWYLTTVLFGAEISPGARIGPGIYFPHPIGIVIGTGVTIGNRVSIYQGVTLGRTDLSDPKLPTVGDNAILYAGAKLLGSIHVGAGSIVGANSVVLRDVPPLHIAVGIPATIRPKRVTS